MKIFYQSRLFLLFLLSLVVCLEAQAQQLTFQTQMNENFIPASSQNIWYIGRTKIQTDGSRIFDWEGTQIFLNIQNGTYVKAVFETVGSAYNVIIAQVNGWEASKQFIKGFGPRAYDIAINLDNSSVNQIRLFLNLEPCFGGINDAQSYIRFVGFATDGIASQPGPFRTRKLEMIGDSITSGYGSRGYNYTQCSADDITSGNINTFNYYLAEYFNAEMNVIAWSGKGIYENCCDDNITMTQYYLQTLAGNFNVSDWDFTRFVPDALIINLGLNDFDKESGNEWLKNFTKVYVDFVLSAVRRYNKLDMPVFVALGPVDGKKYYDCLQNAIEEINKQGGNAHFLEMRGPYDDGCDGHPGIMGHQQIFEVTRPQIAQVMGWEQNETKNLYEKKNIEELRLTQKFLNKMNNKDILID